MSHRHIMVQGVELPPSTRIPLAANGTRIRVCEEIPLKIWRNFAISTNFLVSDQICEIMFGMDWLRQHKCHIGFSTCAIFFDRGRIPLVKGNGVGKVVVSEDTMIDARSKCDVSSKTLYGGLGVMAPAWMTETGEFSPGVRVARVLLDDARGECQVRIINLGEQSVRQLRLNKNQDIGRLHLVQVNEEDVKRSMVQDKDEKVMLEMLTKDLLSEVPYEAKEQLNKLLVVHKDVLSLNEGNLGKTKACEHKIDTGNAHPVKQPFRR